MGQDERPKAVRIGQGERLKAARKKAGFRSAAAACKQFGWVPSTYRGHEAGVREISKSGGLEYSRAFGVSMSWLLTGHDLDAHATRTTVEMEDHHGETSTNKGAAILHEQIGVRVVPVVPWDAVEAMENRNELKLSAAAIDRLAVADLNLSKSVYALRIKDEAMTGAGDRAVLPGDHVIADPAAPLEPGRVVVAHVQGDPEAVVRRYRPDPDPDYVVLVSGNEDYPPRRVRRGQLTYMHRVTQVQRQL